MGSLAALPFSESVVYFTNSPFMGGMEAHIQHLATALSNAGGRVSLVCPATTDIALLKDACREAGVAVSEIADGGGPLGAIRRFRAYVRELSRFRGGVLHIHMTGPFGGELVMLAAKLAGIKVIVRTEHQPLEQPPSLVQLWRMKMRDRFLGRVICVSQQTAAYFIDLGRDGRKFLAIPNGVDVSRFDPGTVDRDSVGRRLGIDPEAVVVGMVSRLHEERKGGANFIEMAARLAPDCPQAHFLVVGDGELRPLLEQQASDRGVRDRVLFLGSRTDIPELLAAIDIFVMPSHWEGGPISVLEAMAMRRPIVATNVGMVPDVIRDGVTGYMVPPGDTSALTDAVRSLLTDPAAATEIGCRARDIVLSGFSQHAMVERTAALYATLLQES
jgi:glycosyltransferase involved in cell wall biosynthesis